MKICCLETRSFRNLADPSVSPGPRLNVIFGANAQGKSNFLEAVYFIACLRSFRATRTSEMIRFGGALATIRSAVETEGVERTLEVEVRERSRRAWVDGKAVRSSAAYLGGLKVVLFSPEDVLLPRGAPVERRHLLDRAICNLWPSYLLLGRDYQRTLLNRNQVLRESRLGAQGKELLEVYDEQLAELGARLVAARLRYLRGLGPRFTEVFAGIGDSTARATLAYSCPEELICVQGARPEELAPLLRAELARARGHDLARHGTSVGPQTHDVVFQLDERQTRAFASQGQLRLLVLAFKIAQILDAFERSGDYPVLLLDDVSSELDASHSKYLFEFIRQIPCQAFLTTTRPELIPAFEKSVKFQIVNGIVRREN